MSVVGATKRKVEARDDLLTKKSRQNDDSFGDVMAFESELEMPYVLEASGFKAPSSAAKVRRPPVRSIDPTKDAIVFQQLEVDHYVGTHITGMPGPYSGPCPVLRMYGINMEGNSVLAHIHGFLPYLYVPAPAEDFDTENCVDFRVALNNAILQSNRDNIQEAVLDVEIVNKCSILGFHFNQKYPFLKITVVLPKLVAPAKRLLENGITLQVYGSRAFQVYESNIEYEIRLMVDVDVIGCNWIECPAGKYILRKPWYQGIEQVKPEACQSKPHVQIELDISWQDFISHPAEGDWQKCAPLRVLSFDIECSGRQGIFPEAKHDSVIQIANMVMLQGEKDPFIRNVFTLKSCDPIPGSDVRCFDKEEDLLQVQEIRTVVGLMCTYCICDATQFLSQSWSEFFQEVDADIITGYNIINFDLPYLLDRAKHLKVTKFPYLGRIDKELTTMKDSTFGKRVNKVISIEGRVQFDLLPVSVF